MLWSAKMLNGRKTIFNHVNSHMVLRFLYCSLLILTACQSPSTKDSTEGQQEEYLEFRTLYLQKAGIPAYIMIPDETANIGATTQPEIIHEDGDFLWTIKTGPYFTLRIEDFGDYSNRLDDKKKELSEQNKFTIRYLLKEKNILVYEQTLIVNGVKNAPTTVGVEHRSLHVYAQFEIDGVYYELRSPDEGYPRYQRRVVDLMAKSIASFKAIRQQNSPNL